MAKVGGKGLGRGRRAEVAGREGGSWREVDRVGGKGVRDRWAGLGGTGDRGRRAWLG